MDGLVERDPTSIRKTNEVRFAQFETGEHVVEPYRHVDRGTDTGCLRAASDVTDRVDRVHGMPGAEGHDIGVPRRRRHGHRVNQDDRHTRCRSGSENVSAPETGLDVQLVGAGWPRRQRGSHTSTSTDRERRHCGTDRASAVGIDALGRDERGGAAVFGHHAVVLVPVVVLATCRLEHGAEQQAQRVGIEAR